MKLQDIFDGKGEYEVCAFQDGTVLRFKHLSDQIVCQDNVMISVQGSHTHYCRPRDDDGPYTHVEVGYPTSDLPETWAQYGEGDFPSSIYARVPIELVREFVESHGGEMTRQEAADTN